MAIKSSTRRIRERTKATQSLRNEVRYLLGGDDSSAAGEAYENGAVSEFTTSGLEYVVEEIVGPLRRIRGSYFGMLQGKWPMHLLSEQRLPRHAFENHDVVKCRVYSRDDRRHWVFSPVEYERGQPGWFELEFDIPKEIANYVQNTFNNSRGLARLKRQQFSYLDLTGKIDGIHRQVRLELDEPWLQRYLRLREY
jgi:hypothetical protein